QPAATATAGTPFAPQPVILSQDQFNNLVSGDNSTVVTATRNAGSGSLQGSTSIMTAGGVITFTNLSHNVATNITIDFAAPGLIGVTSGTVAVNSASAASLAFVQSPTDELAGAVISPAITVRASDSFGNNVASLAVTLNLSTGTGVLSGTTTRNTDA